MRAILTVAIVAALMLAARLASADEKADAKKHFEAGKALFNAEDFKGAVVEFEESIRLFKTKSAIFNLANCYKGLKRYSESLASLKLLEGEFGKSIDAEMKSAVATIRKEIESTTGTLEVRVDQVGSSVFVDGELVGVSPLSSPLLLGSGYHEVRAELQGKLPVVEKVKLISGDKLEITMSVANAASPPVQAPAGGMPVERSGQSGRRSPALLAVSIVGTALTVGLGVAGGVFWSKTANSSDDYNRGLKIYGDLDPDGSDYDELEEQVHDDIIRVRDEVEKNNRAAVGLTVGAGVAAAASVVFWILYAKSGEETAEPTPVSFAPAPGGVGVEF